MARPTSYKAEYDALAYKYCLLGATNPELASFFEVVTSTVDLWIRTHETFSGAVKKGREEADANVAARLYARAIGYDLQEEKAFVSGKKIIKADVKRHYPGDTAAAIFWLKNRKPREWRDKPSAKFKIDTEKSLSEQSSDIIKGISDGSISSADGCALVNAIAQHAKIQEIDELTKRIAAIENQEQ